jgi:transposase
LLLTLWLLGYIDLYFADETGFTMQPYVPYAWQKKKETHRIFARRSPHRLNVLGLMRLDNQVTVYHREKPIDGEFIMNSFNAFCKKSYTKPRVIILDNGPVHHAKVVKDKLAEWEAADLHLFYLPTYSPHLNAVEILWRFCKYKWLTKSHYKSWSTLKKAILSIFRGFGSAYCINFENLVLKNTISNIKANSA